MSIGRFHDQKKLSSRGFTLVELMVAVAIVSILASLAVNSYDLLRRKALATEAKMALSAVYAAETSFYAEYSTYTPCLANAGYLVDGGVRRFRVGYSAVAVGAAPNDPVTGQPCMMLPQLDAGGFATTATDIFPGSSTVADGTMMQMLLTQIQQDLRRPQSLVL